MSHQEIVIAHNITTLSVLPLRMCHQIVTDVNGIIGKRHDVDAAENAASYRVARQSTIRCWF